jgi:pyruvate dehydrogenase kinase 2/3/4
MDDSRIDALRSASSSPHGFKGTLDQRVEMWQGKRQGEDSVARELDPETQVGVGSHPRMGIGLPLSNIFAT